MGGLMRKIVVVKRGEENDFPLLIPLVRAIFPECEISVFRQIGEGLNTEKRDSNVFTIEKQDTTGNEYQTEDLDFTHLEVQRRCILGNQEDGGN